MLYTDAFDLLVIAVINEVMNPQIIRHVTLWLDGGAISEGF